jgi:hypothetical protein
MESGLSKKNQFKQNPSIDPYNHTSIVIGSKRYKELVTKYGEPNKIKSPKSKKLISVGKGEYKKLKLSGYTDNQLIEGTVNLYYINNKNYTENELMKMIQFYETHHDIPKNIDIPSDMLNEIMLNADIKTIHQYCLTDKNAMKLCQNNQFWKFKFEKNQLPLLYEVPNENFKLIDTEYLEEDYIKHEPTTLKEWEILYIDTQFFIHLATKLVENIIKTNKFTEFYTPEIPFYEYQWLPVAWFKYVHKLNVKNIPNVPEIYYEIIIKKNKIQYKISLTFQDLGNDENLPSLEIILSKNDFIINLSKLFYYQRNFDPDEIFISNQSEDDPEAIFISDLLKDDLKNIFPNW